MNRQYQCQHPTQGNPISARLCLVCCVAQPNWAVPVPNRSLNAGNEPELKTHRLPCEWPVSIYTASHNPVFNCCSSTDTKAEVVEDMQLNSRQKAFWTGTATNQLKSDIRDRCQSAGSQDKACGQYGRNVSFTMLALVKQVKLLGHFLTQEGVLPHPENVLASHSFPSTRWSGTCNCIWQLDTEVKKSIITVWPALNSWLSRYFME